MYIYIYKKKKDNNKIFTILLDKYAIRFGYPVSTKLIAQFFDGKTRIDRSDYNWYAGR